MSQNQNTQENLSQRYKGYKARAKAEGREALPFPTWKRMYGTRAPRNSKATQPAVVVQTQPDVNDLFAQFQAFVASQQPAQVTQPVKQAVKQAQPSQGHVTIQNPDEQATGRQLWKLMDLGLIEFISKGDASQLIENALATA